MTKRHSALAASLFTLCLGTATSLVQAQEEVGRFDSSAGELVVTQVAGGLENPWSIGFLPDGSMLVTERSGALRLIREGEAGTPVDGVPQVAAIGQGGLLDVAVAPDFESTGRIYLSYAEPAESAGQPSGYGTAVMAARLDMSGDVPRLSEQSVIFRMNKYTTTRQHFGSRIVIGNDGNLFVTLGERGEAERAQDMTDLAGAVVRIAPDGSVPADNPKPEGWAPELWSKGHRNPQGAVLRESDGQLFVVEHGPRGGDEVNMPLAGRNYGWPEIGYGVHYSGEQIGVGTQAPGYEQPLFYWDPSISPSGLDFYEADLFPQWKGDLLTGGLNGQVMMRLGMDGDQVVDDERLFEGQLGRIRDVEVGPDGAIYLAIDDPNGSVLKVTPAES